MIGGFGVRELHPPVAGHQSSNNVNWRSLFNVAKCNLGKVKKESMLVSGHSLKICVGTSALIRVLSAWSELDLFLARAIYLVDTLGFRALALC